MSYASPALLEQHECSCGNGSHLHLLAKRVLRYDPSRTGAIRTGFTRDLDRRFALVKAAIRHAIVDLDVMGLGKEELKTFGGPGSGAFGHKGRPGQVGGGSSVEGSEKGIPLEERFTGEGPKPSREDRKSVKKAMRSIRPAYIDQRLDSDSDLDLIAKRGQKFSTKGIVNYKGIPNECHTNASLQFRSGKADAIVTGYALSTSQSPFWGQHSWAVKDGKILEGQGAGLFKAYYGVQLSKAESRQFAIAQGVKMKKLTEVSEQDPRWSVEKIPWREDGLQVHASIPLNKYEFAYDNSATGIRRFIRWLNDEVDDKVLKIVKGPQLQGTATGWTDVYIDSAYKKGMQRGETELNKKGIKFPKPDFAPRFIDSAFNMPFHVDRVALLHMRTYDDLKGITQFLSNRIAHTLAEGMAKGLSPLEMARSLSEDTDIGRSRARTIARTEIIRAHHMASMGMYRAAQIEGVEVEAEWSTAGDDKVCTKCQALEGKVFSIDDIEGRIPLHPNCRCVAIPANVGEKRSKLKLFSRLSVFGGKGSGAFGHKGRPGQVGGGRSTGGKSVDLTSSFGGKYAKDGFVGTFNGKPILVGAFEMSPEKMDEEARRIAPKLDKVAEAWVKAIHKVDPKIKLEVRSTGKYLKEGHPQLKNEKLTKVNVTVDGPGLGLSISLYPNADGNVIRINDSDIPRSMQRKGIFSAGLSAIVKDKTLNLSGKMAVHFSTNDKAWKRIAEKNSLNWKEWQEGPYTTVPDKDLHLFK
jgi:SPP1 gp7 family putative phage head morphogenesis protein